MFRKTLTYVTKNKITLSALFFSMIFSSCKRQLNQPNIEGEIIAPLAHATLSIQNLLADSLTTVNSDGTVSIVYRNSLYQAQLGSFEPLETREFNQTAKLQQLVLSQQTAVRTISLGQVATNAGLIGQILINQNGSNGVIPPLPGMTYGPLPVDGSQYFETITLDSGYMDVTIQNGFPTGLSNIQFEIRNESDNSLVGQSTFTNVAAGATATKTMDLAGKTIEGNLIGNILNFDVDGSNGQQVPIDTSDQLVVTFVVRDMKVHSATAIFPAQDIITMKDTAAMNGVNDLRITKAIAKEGIVNLRVVSTIEDTMYFDYIIPSGTKDGQPFEIHEKINPAPSGGSIEKILQYSVAGYEFDLTGAPIINHYNAFYSELTGRIDSTGNVVNLSLDDSLLLYIKLGNFIPEYAEGYLGHSDTVIGPTAVPFDLFNSITSGSINFEEVKLSVGVTNGNAVPFDVELQTLKAVNNKTNQTVNLGLSSLPSPLSIGAAATLNTPWQNTWAINNAGTEINQALNIFPNMFEALIRIESNPLQDSNSLTQFAIDSNLLDAYVDLEVPLNFSANQLTLVDTVSFDASGFATPEMIEKGTLNVIATNTYPISAKLGIKFLDENNTLLTSISFMNQIEASDYGQHLQSNLMWPFSQDDLQLISNASKIIFQIEFSTSGDVPVKLYSYQNIDLHLTTQFTYKTAE